MAVALADLRKAGLVEKQSHVGTRVKVEGQSWSEPPDGQPHDAYIEAQIRLRIANGTYKPGSQIPTLEALAEEFGVGVPNARRGLKPLRDEDLISARVAHGTYVAERPPLGQPTATGHG
ncbi:GntR family transcriptional regulator [Streptomyces sp. NPDC053726]|uniref:GntR family transcriptional regulator n=1 Tax=Streptomyces sp. NPDC053726 TaxID=3365713 RepID=UPI0037D28320